MSRQDFEQLLMKEQARWEHGLRREWHYARFRSRRAYQLDQQVQANVAAYWRQLLPQSIQESQAA